MWLPRDREEGVWGVGEPWERGGSGEVVRRTFEEELKLSAAVGKVV